MLWQRANEVDDAEDAKHGEDDGQPIGDIRATVSSSASANDAGDTHVQIKMQISLAKMLSDPSDFL